MQTLQAKSTGALLWVSCFVYTKVILNMDPKGDFLGHQCEHANVGNLNNQDFFPYRDLLANFSLASLWDAIVNGSVSIFDNR